MYGIMETDHVFS